MSNGDSIVPVTGPDGQLYHFPTGTTKESAVSYFKKKGIGAAPSSAPGGAPPQAKVEPAAPPISQPPTRGQAVDQSLEQWQGSISKWRPRWDDPQKMLQDPKWYDPGTPRAGQMATGAMRAVGHMALGGTKILNDLFASLDPGELSHRPAGEPGTQFAKDVYGVGQGFLDVTKAAYDLVRHFPEAEKDPDKLGETLMNIAMTVDGGIKGAHAIAEHAFPSPMEAVKSTQDAALSGAQGLGQTAKDAVLTAKHLSKGATDSLFHQKAIEDAFVHKNGVDVAKEIVKAKDEAFKEVKTHVDNLSKIDSNVPSGVIDASKEADVIKTAFADVVKTPDPLNPVLNSMVKDAASTAPGQWTFEKTRQFRSKIGRALNKVEGPQKAVLSRVYGDLSNKLKKTAAKYGLEDSWNHYNELERKISKSFDIIDTAHSVVDENGAGAKMATALKDKAVVKEVVDSLSKYGLDREKLVNYSTRANKLLKDRNGSFRSIFRQVYGMPGAVVAIPALATVRAAGGGYIPGLAAGALTGIGTTYLIHAIRAARLSADTLDGILSSREWPGRRTPPEGDFPEAPPEEPSATPQTPTPQLPQGAAPMSPPAGPSAQAATVPATTPAERVVEDMKKYHEAASKPAEQRSKPRATATTSQPIDPLRIARMNELRKIVRDKNVDIRDRSIAEIQLRDYEAHPSERNLLGDSPEQLKKPKAKLSKEEAETASQQRKVGEVQKLSPEAVGTEPGARPGTTRESKVGRATKQRERVAATRKEKGSTALGGGTQEITGGGVAEELAKAQERLQSPHLSVENIQIPDMEQALQRLSPRDYKLLQGLRKKKALSDAEYEEGLRHFLVIAYEDKIRDAEK